MPNIRKSVRVVETTPFHHVIADDDVGMLRTRITVMLLSTHSHVNVDGNVRCWSLTLKPKNVVELLTSTNHKTILSLYRTYSVSLSIAGVHIISASIVYVKLTKDKEDVLTLETRIS